MKASKFTLLLLLPFSFANAANIVWVTDLLPIGSGTSDNDGGANGVFGAGAGPYADQGFLNLLTGAGHTVTRFNPAASPAALSAGDVSTLNGYDLIIIGRSIGSGSFDTAVETQPWNVQITKPILGTNTYLTRASRLGWFSGSTQPDVVSNVLNFTDLSNPVQAFLSAGLVTGSATNMSVTEAVIFPDAAVDIRGTSLVNEPVVAGGTTIATTNGGLSQWIATLPAGTTLAGTSAGQVLGGFRMQFLAGNRESASAPNNTVGSAGFENLTADGEVMFLRAVALAANNGVVPVPEPATFTLAGLAGLALLRRRRSN